LYGLHAVGERARARDPVFFFASLFAAEGPREAMWLLHAVHAELLRALSVSEPLIGAIRVQWWREVLEGEARRHELATPLGEALAAGRLPRAAMLGLCDAADTAIEAQAPAVLWRALGEAFGVVLGADAAMCARLGALWEALGARLVPAASRWPREVLPAALPAVGRRARMPRLAMLVAVALRRA
jgi:phytoene synthase